MWYLCLCELLESLSHFAPHNRSTSLPPRGDRGCGESRRGVSSPTVSGLPGRVSGRVSGRPPPPHRGQLAQLQTVGRSPRTRRHQTVGRDVLGESHRSDETALSGFSCPMALVGGIELGGPNVLALGFVYNLYHR